MTDRLKAAHEGVVGGGDLHLRSFAVVLLLLHGLACSAPPASTRARAIVSTAPGQRSFTERRAAHRTRLGSSGPSPNSWEEVQPPPGVEVVRYLAQNRELLGFLWLPEGAPPHPAVVFFHGSFELEQKVFDDVRGLVEAGCAVWMPTYRGEQGNPGRFELLYGEVDDAATAARWLAARPEIDPGRVSAIGHSAGGAIAALLSLIPNLPLHLTASVGGIYVPETFARWLRMKHNRALIRFDPNDREETELRTLGPHLRDMQRPHRAYVGREDPWFLTNTRSVLAQAERLRAPFAMELVAGDHMGSLAAALRAFERRIDCGANAGTARRATPQAPPIAARDRSRHRRL